MTQPKLLPLVAPINSRYQSLTVDSRLVNAIAEKGDGEDEVFVYKRPSFKLFRSLGAGTGRGIFNWNGDIYAVVGGALFKNATNLGAVAAAASYTFTTCLGATPLLFLQNGVNAYTVNAAGTIAAVVDVDYPASTVPGAVYLDGTIYVMTATAEIHGSLGAGNDPTNWDPLNKILAQIEPQKGVYLAKQLVFVLAMKEHYTEAFYDAGNAVGSPLTPVGGAKMNFGCADAKTVRDLGGDLMWVADSGEGTFCAVIVSSLKVEVVSTTPVERILSSGTVGSFTSWNIKVEGHRLYGVSNSVANFTLVFDATSRIWYQWTTAAGNYLPYSSSTVGIGTAVYFLHESSGKIYTLDLFTYVDEGDSAFPCAIYTPNFDGGTRRYKTLPRLDLLGDQVSTTVSVAWSDDDYATWSTALTADMSLDRPSVDSLGSFTKRAFRIIHQANTPFRLRAAELYLDLSVA